MKRVYIKFTYDDHMNIEGDYIVHDGEFIYVYNGDNVVAMARPEIVNLICISEKQVLTKKELITKFKENEENG